jgi:putative DNA-invertase from lambdoid prophage Rac
MIQMPAHAVYYRVSTRDQSIEAQRSAMATGGVTFEREFMDEGISGATQALHRGGFRECAEWLRQGDTLHVYAVDRLGRDSIDVQTTVRTLMEKGVIVDIHGIGPIVGETGKLIVALLAQVAQIEKNRILERTTAGRDVAKAKGVHLGRKPSMGEEEAVEALRDLKSSGNVARTAEKHGLSRQALIRLRDSDAKHAVAARAAAGVTFGVGDGGR